MSSAVKAEFLFWADVLK